MEKKEYTREYNKDYNRENRDNRDSGRDRDSNRDYNREKREINVYEYFNNGTRVREDEPIEIALKRFKREVTNAGTLTELKKREFYEKPSVIKKRALDTAIRKRMRKKVLFGE